MTTNTEIIRKDKAVRSHGDKGYWVLGNIIVDGPEGNIIVKDDNLNDIVTIDPSGITVNIPSSYDTIKEFINFKKVGVSVGGAGLKRWTSAGTAITDMIFRSYEPTDTNRNTYVTMAIYGSDLITRKNFFQISTSVTAGVITGYNWNPGVTNKFVCASIDTDLDGLGSLKLPQKASDPSVENGRIYYNTATNKVRICEGSTWKDVV